MTGKDITLGNLVNTIIDTKTNGVKKTLWRVTRTDTFGDKWSGNYSWRRDVEFSLPATAKRQAVVTRIKAAYGLTNVKCDTQMIGDTIAISPRDNTVIFAEPEYD